MLARCLLYVQTEDLPSMKYAKVATARKLAWKELHAVLFLKASV